MSSYPSFVRANASIVRRFKDDSKIVKPATWQSIDVSAKPEMATHELEDMVFSFPIGTRDLAYHKHQIQPNLPWADDHFEKDRVSGEPLNPGYTWAQWPWANKADGFRNEHGQFNHSYAERYWPKYAMNESAFPNRGIRYEYGDLNDVVDLLVRNPGTRNAYLPLWFPEDTGVVHGNRTPCSIGYLFRMREDRLSIFYDIRSCDYIRHFRDDVYLTVRLLLWVLNECEKKDPSWTGVWPGKFTMHIGSFHIFENDWRKFNADQS